MSQKNLQVRKNRVIRRVAIPILVAAMMLLSVQAVLAYLDRVVLQDYIVDLVGYDINGNQSTWVYAVTYNISSTNESPPALSHWTLGMDLTCYDVVEPAAAETNAYTTPTDPAYGCGDTYTCAEATYALVEYGKDATLGLVDGIKWADVSSGPQIGPSTPDTQIFVLTVQADEHRIGEVPVGVKYGANNNITGTITGPVCPPNAVQMASVSASSGGWATPILLMAILTFGGLTYVGLRLARKDA